MGQGPAPFLRATAQLDDPGAPCRRLTAKADRKRVSLPRTKAATHPTRTLAQCTIVIAHEQGTEVRSEMNTPPSPVHARETPPRKACPLAPVSPLAPRESGALRSVCCPALAARKPRLRLLGGFASRTDPKRRAVPTFPQVDEANGDNLRRKPSRSPGHMAKSAPVSCKTVQKSQGTNAC